MYHLLLKAIFEIKQIYPQAYRMAIEYRKWLLSEIFDVVFSLESHALKPNAIIVLNLIDGLILQILIIIYRHFSKWIVPDWQSRDSP